MTSPRKAQMWYPKQRAGWWGAEEWWCRGKSWRSMMGERRGKLTLVESEPERSSNPPPE
jgi:hypothetical protein